MKSFKLVSLHVESTSELLEVPLVDGLIINREDEHSSWLAEAYINVNFYDKFLEMHNDQRELIIHAIITKKENDPAFFKMKVCSVKLLKDHVSVLFEGTLKRTRSDYAELLLEDLMSKGLSGDALKEEFKLKMKTRPPIVSNK